MSEVLVRVVATGSVGSSDTILDEVEERVEEDNGEAMEIQETSARFRRMIDESFSFYYYIFIYTNNKLITNIK